MGFSRATEMKTILAASAIVLILAIFLPGTEDDQQTSNRDPAETGDINQCTACHPSFGKQSNQTSSAGHSNPFDGLRKNHLTKGAGYGCLNCHGGMVFDERQVSLCALSTPADGVNQRPIGCSICHGGTADDLEIGSIPNTSWSTRLREHHYRRGVTECLGCHGDAAPVDLVPPSVSPPALQVRDQRQAGFAKFKKIPPPQKGQRPDDGPHPD